LTANADPYETYLGEVEDGVSSDTEIEFFRTDADDGDNAENGNSNEDVANDEAALVSLSTNQRGKVTADDDVDVDAKQSSKKAKKSKKEAVVADTDDVEQAAQKASAAPTKVRDEHKRVKDLDALDETTRHRVLDKRAKKAVSGLRARVAARDGHRACAQAKRKRQHERKQTQKRKHDGGGGGDDDDNVNAETGAQSTSKRSKKSDARRDDKRDSSSADNDNTEARDERQSKKQSKQSNRSKLAN
jgi:hypothetical protein